MLEKLIETAGKENKVFDPLSIQALLTPKVIEECLPANQKAIDTKIREFCGALESSNVKVEDLFTDRYQRMLKGESVRELAGIGANDVFNPLFTTGWDSVIDQILPEYTNNGSFIFSSEILPMKEVRTQKIIVERQNLGAGVMQEYIPGKPLPRVEPVGRSAGEMSFGSYGEAMEFDRSLPEFMRLLGTMDMNGWGKFLSQQSARLAVRRGNLVNLQTVNLAFTGKVRWQNKEADFGSGISLNSPAPFYDYISATGEVVVNQNFNIIEWFRKVYMTDMRFRALKGRLRRILVHPFVAYAILTNRYTQSFIRMFEANNAQFNASKMFTVDNIMSLSIPGLPPIQVVDNAWTNTTVWDQDWSTMLGQTEYFMPNGGIYFDFEFPDAIGNFAIQPNILSGGFMNPQPSVSFNLQDMSAISADTQYLLMSTSMNGNAFLRYGMYRCATTSAANVI